MFLFERRIFSYDVGFIDDELFLLSEEKKIKTRDRIVFDHHIDGSGFYISRFGGYYWVDDHNGQMYVFDEITGALIFQNEKEKFKATIGYPIVVIDSDNILVSRRLGREKVKSILNISDFTFNDVAYRGTYGFPDFYLVIDKVFDEERRVDYLIGYNTRSSAEIWRYEEFQEYADGQLVGIKKIESVYEIFGVAEGLLWVHLTSDRIVGLSPQTGECIKSIGFDDVDNSDFKYHPEKFKHIVTNWGYMFIPEESKIVSLPRGRYTEIDLTAVAPVRKCFNTEHSFIDAGVACSGRMIAHGNMIYFCDGMSTKVGAFDRDKKEVVWVDDLKNYQEGAGMPAKILATDTHVYFHDTNKNLFVFNRA